MPILKSNSGFSLLEVLIAISILSIVLVAVFQLQSQNVALGVRARFNAIAPMLANQAINEICAVPEDLSVSDSGDFGDEFPGYNWQSEVSDVDSESLEETAKRLKMIDVIVGAEETGCSYHLRTYRFFESTP
jgi:general secretion pathway protein I